MVGLFGFSPTATIFLFSFVVLALYFPLRRFTTPFRAVLLSFGAFIFYGILSAILSTQGVGYFVFAPFALGILLPLAYEVRQRLRE